MIHVFIDGKEVAMKIKKSKEQLMLPIEVMAKDLNWTIQWDKKKEMVNILNEKMNAIIKVGIDIYMYTWNKNVGMMNPVKLGVAPLISEGMLYVPKKFLELLLRTNTEEDKIYFETKKEKEKEKEKEREEEKEEEKEEKEKEREKEREKEKKEKEREKEKEEKGKEKEEEEEEEDYDYDDDDEE
ncbi:MAG: stalk domain-containing protein [Cellulosilyticaceae bacterium]